MTRVTCELEGSAGYTGTHIGDEFNRAGKAALIYDALCQRLESRMQALRTKHILDIPLIKADIPGLNEHEDLIQEYKIDSVVDTVTLKAVYKSRERSDRNI